MSSLLQILITIASVTIVGAFVLVLLCALGFYVRMIVLIGKKYLKSLEGWDDE